MCSNNNGRSDKQQRKVRFSDETTVIPTTDVIESEQDKTERWYTPQDLKEIRANSSDDDNDDACSCPKCSVRNKSGSLTNATSAIGGSRSRRLRFRGSVPSSSSAPSSSVCTCVSWSAAGRERQRAFVSSVLAQQWEHRQMGIQDPKGLFQLSRRCSKASREQARHKAAVDAVEARRIAQETTRVIDDVLSIMADLDI